MSAIDNTDAELEAFDTACRRLGGFDDRVSAEWADGYLTALAAGPRAVPVDEWLPRLAGDAFERAFADPEDVAWARRSLTARGAMLARQLDAETLIDHPDELRLQPLVALWDDAARAALIDEQGVAAAEAGAQHTGALWAAGFLDALEDFAADWQSGADVDDEDAVLFDELLGHVRVLLLDDADAGLKAHVERYWKDRLATREDLLDEACFAIQDLRVWWTDHAPRPPPRQVEARPGRNDPCPCGSGRKFKKCHGQPA